MPGVPILGIHLLTGKRLGPGARPVLDPNQSGFPLKEFGPERTLGVGRGARLVERTRS